MGSLLGGAGQQTDRGQRRICSVAQLVDKLFIFGVELHVQEFRRTSGEVWMENSSLLWRIT